MSDRLTSAALETLTASLTELVGDRIATARSVRDQHGTDMMHPAPAAPDIVVYPQTTREVAAVAALCNSAKAPIIPFGAGTSVEGQILAPHGGVSVDLSQMDAIIEVRPDDLDVTVQAGVTREALNRHLRDTGLFFPVDPGANATLGGMLATRASGTTTIRYGAMREAALALTVVLADGAVVRTGSRARKSSTGYDLTRLMIGSEGTLGIITEATLRVHGVPEQIRAATCAFANVDAAVKCVISLIQMGAAIARAEMLDALSIRAVNQHSHLSLAEKPTLFLEFHGAPEGLKEQIAQAHDVAKTYGGAQFTWAQTTEERSMLWRARHEAAFASMALAPGSERIPTDVCVPISALADCISQTQTDINTAKILATIGGHVGDGNFHVMMLVRNEAERERAHEIHHRLIRRAIAMDGACSGEHGIGIGKMPYLAEEVGEDGITMMRRIKVALDPDGLMNPGKIFCA